jgi:hypothetical protein
MDRATLTYSLPALVALAASPGCIDGLTQVAGTGAVYTAACSAEMVPQGLTYTAACEPPPCYEGFFAAPVQHRVVALDPGRKVVGVAERVCVQDLARASGLFNPALLPPELRPTPAAEGAAPAPAEAPAPAPPSP